MSRLRRISVFSHSARHWVAVPVPELAKPSGRGDGTVLGLTTLRPEWHLVKVQYNRGSLRKWRKSESLSAADSTNPPPKHGARGGCGSIVCKCLSLNEIHVVSGPFWFAV